MSRLILGSLVLGCLALPLVAQPSETPARTMSVAAVPASQNVTVRFGPGPTPIEEFLAVWSESTGLNLSYPENLFRGRCMVGLGVTTINRSDLDFLFQSLLVRHGFALVPSGPPDAAIMAVEQIDQSRMLKQSACWVPRDEVPGLDRRPAEVFMTVFSLEHAQAKDVRAPLNFILSNRNAEFVQDVPSSNSIVVVGFGPTLAAVHSLITAVDVPSALKEPEKPAGGAAPDKGE
jgi:hypothetical protein